MSENGILAKVGGSDIAAAIDLLPSVEIADDEQTVEMLTQHNGLVRFYARKMKASHHKHMHWFWSVYRAEPVE